LKALERRVASRYDIFRWAEEHEPFLMMELDNGVDRITEADKLDMPTEDFGHVVKKNFWDIGKELIKRYELYHKRLEEKTVAPGERNQHQR